MEQTASLVSTIFNSAVVRLDKCLRFNGGLRYDGIVFILRFTCRKIGPTVFIEVSLMPTSSTCRCTRSGDINTMKDDSIIDRIYGDTIGYVSARNSMGANVRTSYRFGRILGNMRPITSVIEPISPGRSEEPSLLCISTEGKVSICLGYGNSSRDFIPTRFFYLTD